MLSSSAYCSLRVHELHSLKFVAANFSIGSCFLGQYLVVKVKRTRSFFATCLGAIDWFLVAVEFVYRSSIFSFICFVLVVDSVSMVIQTQLEV